MYSLPSFNIPLFILLCPVFYNAILSPFTNRNYVLCDGKKITWYDLREKCTIPIKGFNLIFLAVFLPLIGHIARYIPSSSEKNISKI